MPTATSSMHTDPSLSEASIRTAERGITILRTLMGSELARKNCRAICRFHLFWHSLLVLSMENARALYSSDTRRRQHDDTPVYTHYSIDAGEIITCHPDREDSMEGSFVSTCEIVALLPFHEVSEIIVLILSGMARATLGLPWNY
jgi:hypothetical protein